LLFHGSVSFVSVSAFAGPALRARFLFPPFVSHVSGVVTVAFPGQVWCGCVEERDEILHGDV
jgi:hypothetical protein